MANSARKQKYSDYLKGDNIRAKRVKWLEVLRSADSSNEEKQYAMDKLTKTRKFSTVRNAKRCKITGRPRGFVNRVAMCRNKFREFMNVGQIPGIRKSSW